MSNDATGDHDVEPTTESQDAEEERNGLEAARYCVPATGDVLSSSRDATTSFWDRFGWERFSGFDSDSVSTARSRLGASGSDAARTTDSRLRTSVFDAGRATESRPGTVTKQLGDKATKIGQNEEHLVRAMSRKRRGVDSEVEVIDTLSSVPKTDQHPVDSIRKKHRPDPLNLSSSSGDHYGYPSWLRSPRVWNGAGPIPYTPPPMLSPARRAPGLFWAAAAPPSQPLWSLFRQPSAFTCE